MDIYDKSLKRENELKIAKFIEPIIQNLFRDIIKSRIKDINDKESLLINYKTENGKLIDLTQIKDTNENDPHYFDFNIYVYFKRQNIFFIVEHWKFKIDITQSQYNILDDVLKIRIKKKLLTFFKSIKCLEKILPLNSLIKKSFDYSFQVKLYQQSNMELNPEENIKNEKLKINLETRDDKYGFIQLIILQLMVS